MSLLAACQSAAVPEPDDSGRFIKFYGGFRSEAGYAMEPTPDGGFVLLGTSSSFGQGDQLYLIKTDANGNPQWQRTFGGPFNDAGRSVQPLPDGGYLVLGDSGLTNGRTVFYLLRTNTEGNSLWSRTFSFGSNLGHEAADLLLVPGGYLLAGNLILPDGSSRMAILRTNLAGEESQSTTPTPNDARNSYGNVGLRNDIAAAQLNLTGNVVLGGLTFTGASGTSSLRLTTLQPVNSAPVNDNSGFTVNQNNADEAATDIQRVNNGFIVVGNTVGAGDQADIFLIKTDMNTQQVWTQVFSLPGSQRALSVWPTADGGYVVAGSTSDQGAGRRDVLLVKTDALGAVEWQRTFGGSGDDWAKCVRQTTDGGYALFGTSSTEGTITCLIKTDAQGNLVP